MSAAEHPKPNLFPELPKEGRAATRKKTRRVARVPVRRRRGRGAVMSPGQMLLDYWNEHALKTGMAVFSLWLVAANWQGVRQVSAQLATAIG
jgi:hypothetical protein